MQVSFKTYLKIVIFGIIFIVKSSAEENICDSPNVKCSENDYVKIYKNLDGMRQDNPELIQILKDQILIPPSDNDLPVNLKLNRFQHFGQYHQVDFIMDLFNLGQKRKKSKKGFFIEAGACEVHSILTANNRQQPSPSVAVQH